MLIAIESFLTLAWVRVSFRFAPQRMLRAAIADRGEGRDADPRIVDIFASVAARTPVGHTCMHRALALQRILARRGTRARLCLGLAEKPRMLPGHAWLEVSGRIINDAPENVARYARLQCR